MKHMAAGAGLSAIKPVLSVPLILLTALLPFNFLHKPHPHVLHVCIQYSSWPFASFRFLAVNDCKEERDDYCSVYW